MTAFMIRRDVRATLRIFLPVKRALQNVGPIKVMIEYRNKVIFGDCREVLRRMPAESVHCCITSPPYWGLRQYDIQPLIWGGADNCDHKWNFREIKTETYSGVHWQHDEGGYGKNRHKKAGKKAKSHQKYVQEKLGFCLKCGAWFGHLGLEPTPELYVEHLVEVFREVWRVLRKDGVLWLNLGDCYATGAGRVGERPGGGEQGDRWAGSSKTGSPLNYRGRVGPMTQPNRMPIPGLKQKDLVGIPWRAAFALQAEGWYLRSDTIWHKPNCMPESCKDRPTRAHEYIFLLTKSNRYYYDADAIRKPHKHDSLKRVMPHRSATGKSDTSGKVPRPKSEGNTLNLNQMNHPNGRNARSVWTIPTQSFRGPHFAVFPDRIAERCVLAGTSSGGCCAACGAPWIRIVEKTGEVSKGGARKISTIRKDQGQNSTFKTGRYLKYETVGWRPSCDCRGEVVPCMILDPFGGAGTVGLVAQRLGRDFVLIELGEGYSEMAFKRIVEDMPLLSKARMAAGKRG